MANWASHPQAYAFHKNLEDFEAAVGLNIVYYSLVKTHGDDLSKVHLAGARIDRVIERADARQLIFLISYPIPAGGSDFPEAILIFGNFNRYVIDGKGTGDAVIQRVEVVERAANDILVRIQTDIGFREVSCMYTFFREGPLPISEY
jgi:hypothetical protein